MKVAALCAGYGGLELGLTHAGIDHELTWYSEIDPAASTVMAHHTDIPNLGDLRDITDPPPVDLVTAGFPCQPVSTAGARRGVDDERWLIRDVVAVWRASGARWLILENVWGLLSANSGRAFAAVLDALAEVGATARWACLRAADVGAPHGRLRWFCVATNTDSEGLEGAEWTSVQRAHRRPADGGGAAPDAGSFGSPPIERKRDPADQGWPSDRLADCASAPRDSGAAPTDATLRSGSIEQDSPDRGWALDGTVARAGGRAGAGDPAEGVRHLGRGAGMAWGPYAPAVHRWERIIGRPAPHPTVGGRLNPQLVEWMMGLPAGWVTDCGLSRSKALHVLGNGVVPQQAAAAISHLGVAA